MVRCYGIYANKRKKKYKVLKSWRKRLHLSFGDDPLLCLKRGCEMEPVLYKSVHGITYGWKDN